MARKYYDVVLPGVRKPAGYGTLVAVLSVGEDKRELWFQNATIVRCIEVDLSKSTAGRPITVKTIEGRS